MPYHTPTAADYDEVCRSLVIPAGYAAVVMGALDELTLSYNWEVVGDQSVAQAVAAMTDMIIAAYESECNLPSEPYTSTPRVKFASSVAENTVAEFLIGQGDMGANGFFDFSASLYIDHANSSVSRSITVKLYFGSYSVTVIAAAAIGINSIAIAHINARIWNQGSESAQIIEGKRSALYGIGLNSLTTETPALWRGSPGQATGAGDTLLKLTAQLSHNESTFSVEGVGELQGPHYHA